MRQELKEKTVLAMYDVRGIQRFIFRTNRVRDIIGASELVENIIMEGLQAVCTAENWPAEQYMTDWEKDDPNAFLSDVTVQMQVLFVGGGNAYVLFRKGALCEKVNRALAKYVLDNTYSLNLAVAVVEMTGSYNEDYKKINEKMREIKATMPQVKPMGAFPFMEIDPATGYPLAAYDNGGKEYVSTETALKRRCLTEEENAERVLDRMVTEKGEDSMLAVVHMDGNGMGKRIRRIMQDKDDYLEAIVTMRRISCYLKDEFMDCYRQMCVAVDGIAGNVKENFQGKLYRKIVVAGDDITFICNAKVALYAVKCFLKAVSNKVMYTEDGLTEQENKRKYAMSACAGVAFFNSHFPFSDAYEVAESCCSNAKRIAKMPENRADGTEDGMIGCYVDYQICRHINAADLNGYRKKHYCMLNPEASDEESVWNNDMMVQRPYYVAGPGYTGVFDLNQRRVNAARDMDKVLWENLRVFQSKDGGRSKYKKLRNAFSYGMQEVKNEIAFLESRQVALPAKGERDELIVTWYDALEIMDICELGGAEA